MTGKVPFEGSSDNRILILVAVERRVPPRPDTGMSDDLWEILNACWAREPSRRPEITTVKDRFQTLLQSLSLIDDGPPRFEPLITTEQNGWNYSVDAQPPPAPALTRHLVREQRPPTGVPSRRTATTTAHPAIAAAALPLHQSRYYHFTDEKDVDRETPGHRERNREPRDREEDRDRERKQSRERERARNAMASDERTRTAIDQTAYERRWAGLQAPIPSAPTNYGKDRDCEWEKSREREQARSATASEEHTRTTADQTAYERRWAGLQAPIPSALTYHEKGQDCEQENSCEHEQARNATASDERMRIAAAWAAYEYRWADLQAPIPSAPTTPLTFHNIPWPVGFQPNSPRSLTLDRIKRLLLSPSHSPYMSPKERLKSAWLLW